MVSDQKPPKTSKELSNAMYDDFKRKAVDAAKKRAVAQNVDYESFKNMVAVAHLKPLQAPSATKAAATAPSWSFAPDGTRMQPGGLAAAEAVAAAALLTSRQTQPDLPSTSGDFTRDLRRHCPSPDAKYSYLKRCGPQLLRSLFRLEISSDTLKELLVILDTCWLGHAGAAEDAENAAGRGGALDEAVWVVQVLDALAASGRFGLALKLTGPAGKQAVTSLFAGLAGAMEAAQSTRADGEAQPGGDDEVPLPDGEEEADEGEGVARAAWQSYQRLRTTYGVSD
ncbi:PR46bm [Haematococcus lacustris]